MEKDRQIPQPQNEDDYWPTAEEFKRRMIEDAPKYREELERLRKPTRPPRMRREFRIKSSV